MKIATNISMLIFTACFVLTIQDRLPAQTLNNGIFLTTKYTKNCQNRLKTYTRTKVCLTPSPIVSMDDYEEITDLMSDPLARDRLYFNLNLSESAYQKIKKLNAQMPAAEFAFVVNNVVIGFISNVSSLKNRIIRVDGSANSPEFKSIHRDLVRLLTSRS